jgi:hypothetical protein
MRAVGYKQSLPIDQAESLIDLEIDKPAPQGRDLLVQVKAISVNPVDTKVRMRAAPKDGEPRRSSAMTRPASSRQDRAGREPVQTGRRGLVRGLDHPPGTNSEFIWSTSASSGQAEVARFRGRRRAAPHLDHRLGNAVRPLRRSRAAAATASHC